MFDDGGMAMESPADGLYGAVLAPQPAARSLNSRPATDTPGSRGHGLRQLANNNTYGQFANRFTRWILKQSQYDARGPADPERHRERHLPAE